MSLSRYRNYRTCIKEVRDKINHIFPIRYLITHIVLNLF
jgi:hypothetical protein